MALTMATQEAVCFLSGRAPAEVAKPTVIMEDNWGTIAIARNPVAHARTNNIICYHYIREAGRDSHKETPSGLC